MTLVVARRGFLLGSAASFLAAPAVVHAANIMPVRSFLVLPDFGWESFEPPQGMTFQWVARAVMGDGAMAREVYMEPMTRAGWRPVDASRYNKQFAIKGDKIEMGGQVLMETEMRGAVPSAVEADATEVFRQIVMEKTGFQKPYASVAPGPSDNTYTDTAQWWDQWRER